VARVWVTPGGTGKIGQQQGAETCFDMRIRRSTSRSRRSSRMTYDVWASVNGGGPTGQAGALRRGLARAGRDQRNRVAMRKAA
jgi:small subunit ribosomal protein S9